MSNSQDSARPLAEARKILAGGGRVVLNYNVERARAFAHEGQTKDLPWPRRDDLLEEFGDLWGERIRLVVGEENTSWTDYRDRHRFMSFREAVEAFPELKAYYGAPESSLRQRADSGSITRFACFTPHQIVVDDERFEALLEHVRSKITPHVAGAEEAEEAFLTETMRSVRDGLRHSGAERIMTERLRQLIREGWTHDHDDEHTEGELALAAVCYAYPPPRPASIKRLWPWDHAWWKPTLPEGGAASSEEEKIKARMRDLEKAGALLAAEIDRLARRLRRLKEHKPEPA